MQDSQYWVRIRITSPKELAFDDQLPTTTFWKPPDSGIVDVCRLSTQHQSVLLMLIVLHFLGHLVKPGGLQMA